MERRPVEHNSKWGSKPFGTKWVDRKAGIRSVLWGILISLTVSFQYSENGVEPGTKTLAQGIRFRSIVQLLDGNGVGWAMAAFAFGGLYYLYAYYVRITARKRKMGLTLLSILFGLVNEFGVSMTVCGHIPLLYSASWGVLEVIFSLLYGSLFYILADLVLVLLERGTFFRKGVLEYRVSHNRPALFIHRHPFWSAFGVLYLLWIPWMAGAHAGLSAWLYSIGSAALLANGFRQLSRQAVNPKTGFSLLAYLAVTPLFGACAGAAAAELFHAAVFGSAVLYLILMVRDLRENRLSWKRGTAAALFLLAACVLEDKFVLALLPAAVLLSVSFAHARKFRYLPFLLVPFLCWAGYRLAIVWPYAHVWSAAFSVLLPQRQGTELQNGAAQVFETFIGKESGFFAFTPHSARPVGALLRSGSAGAVWESLWSRLPVLSLTNECALYTWVDIVLWYALVRQKHWTETFPILAVLLYVLTLLYTGSGSTFIPFLPVAAALPWLILLLKPKPPVHPVNKETSKVVPLTQRSDTAE